MFFTETVFFSSEPLFLLDVKKWVLVFFQLLSKFVSFGSDYLFLTSFGLIIVFYKINWESAIWDATGARG